MKGEATEKIQGGKLVRIKVDFESRINDIKITGDFFMHPEESITDIEKSLIGTDKDAPEEKISDKIKEVVKSKNVTLIGVDEDALAKVLRKAME